LQDFLGRWEDVHICITAHHPDSTAQIFSSTLLSLLGLYKENSERHVDMIKCNHKRKTFKKALQIQTSNFASIKIYEKPFSEM
jgi:Zn ribbon nucleic-acid-binding protein